MVLHTKTLKYYNNNKKIGNHPSPMACQAKIDIPDSEESEDDLMDKMSTTSSRSKDGRFIKTGSRTVHPCPHADCIKYFSRPSRLQTHLLCHTGDQPYKCTKDGCNKSYARSAHLKRHMHQSHNDDSNKSSAKTEENTLEESFKCNQCPKVFANKYSLDKHNKVHQDPLRYVCQYCNESFHKHHFLRSHIILEHNCEKRGEKVPCSKCEKKFTYVSQMKRHFSRHHDKIKDYKCNSCDQIFSKWTSLRAHKSLVHPRIGKNSCEICHKMFKGPSASGNLQVHRATHAATRTVFYCPIKPCIRFYYDQKNLKDHISGYHEGKRFPCTETGCNDRLSSRRKLILHMKSIHSACTKPSKPTKKGIKRAQRVDKGTFKTSMASILSEIEVSDNLNQNDSTNHPKQSKPNILNGDSISNCVEVSSKLSMTVAKSVTVTSSAGQKKFLDKNKKALEKSLFSQLDDLPVFALPSYIKPHTTNKLLQNDKSASVHNEKNLKYVSKLNAKKELKMTQASECAMKVQKEYLPRFQSIKNRKINFSKYVTISTNNYKSSSPSLDNN